MIIKKNTKLLSLNKLTTDKILVFIVFIGFTSVVSITTLEDIQYDAIAHKGVRIASIVLALLLASSVCSVRRLYHNFTAKTLLPFVLFFCSVCITIFWSEAPSLTAFKSIEILLVIFIGLIGIATHRTMPHELVRWVIVIFVIQLSIVWVEAYLFPDLAFKRILGQTPFMKNMLRGVYPVVNPNTVGFLGGIVAVYYFPKVLRIEKIKLYDWIFFAIGIASVIASYSRGSLFVLFIVICIYAIYKRNYKILFIISTFLFGLFLYDKTYIIISHLERGREYSGIGQFSSGRTYIWKIVLDNYKDFIFGQGYAVGFRVNRFLDNTNAHNSFVELFAGGGVISLFAWLLIYFNLFKRIYYLFKIRITSDIELYSISNILLFLFISSFSNIRAVYLDYGMLLLISIAVYIEKENKIVKLF